VKSWFFDNKFYGIFVVEFFFIELSRENYSPPLLAFLFSAYFPSSNLWYLPYLIKNSQ
jgi:hypothetical protein